MAAGEPDCNVQCFNYKKYITFNNKVNNYFVCGEK